MQRTNRLDSRDHHSEVVCGKYAELRGAYLGTRSSLMEDHLPFLANTFPDRTS